MSIRVSYRIASSRWIRFCLMTLLSSLSGEMKNLAEQNRRGLQRSSNACMRHKKMALGVCYERKAGNLKDRDRKTSNR